MTDMVILKSLRTTKMTAHVSETGEEILTVNGRIATSGWQPSSSPIRFILDYDDTTSPLIRGYMLTNLKYEGDKVL